jgi:hypothetical protein
LSEANLISLRAQRLGASLIKRFAQQQIQIVHGQRELAVEARRLRTASGRFKSPRGPPKTRCHGQMLVRIAKLPEQTPDVICPLASGPNFFKRFRLRYLT